MPGTASAAAVVAAVSCIPWHIYHYCCATAFGSDLTGILVPASGSGKAARLLCPSFITFCNTRAAAVGRPPYASCGCCLSTRRHAGVDSADAAATSTAMLMSCTCVEASCSRACCAAVANGTHAWCVQAVVRPCNLWQAVAAMQLVQPAGLCCCCAALCNCSCSVNSAAVVLPLCIAC
jgi:hypothetical protein